MRASFILFYYKAEVLNLGLYYFTIETRYWCHTYLVCKKYW